MKVIICPHCGHEFTVLPAEEEEAGPLRRARLEKDLTIQAAADEMGVSHWTLSRLERGGGNPKLSMLKAISKFYAKPIEELFPHVWDDDSADADAEQGRAPIGAGEIGAAEEEEYTVGVEED